MIQPRGHFSPKEEQVLSPVLKPVPETSPVPKPVLQTNSVLITALNGNPIASFNDLFLELEKYKPGDVISIDIEREEKARTVKLELVESE